MCKCDRNIRTPFCGKPGCEWPEFMTVKQARKSLEKGKAVRMRYWAAGIYLQMVDGIIFRISDNVPVSDPDFIMQEGEWEPIEIPSMSDADIFKMRFLFRYMYLTLGFYATKYNYQWGRQDINGGVSLGHERDQGEQAQEAMKRVIEAGLKRWN